MTARSAPQATASKLTGLSPTRRLPARAGSVWRVAGAENPAASNSLSVRLRVTSAASARRASVQPAATAGNPAVPPVYLSAPSCVLEATTSDALAATAGALAKSAAGRTRYAACQLKSQSLSAMSGSTVPEQAVAISETESARSVGASVSSAALPRTAFCGNPAVRGARALGESAWSAAGSGSRVVRTLTRICGGCADEQVRPAMHMLTPAQQGGVCCCSSAALHVSFSESSRSCRLLAPRAVTIWHLLCSWHLLPRVYCIYCLGWRSGCGAAIIAIIANTKLLQVRMRRDADASVLRCLELYSAFVRVY